MRLNNAPVLLTKSRVSDAIVVAVSGRHSTDRQVNLLSNYVRDLPRSEREELVKWTEREHGEFSRQFSGADRYQVKSIRCSAKRVPRASHTASVDR